MRVNMVQVYHGMKFGKSVRNWYRANGPIQVLRV